MPEEGKVTCYENMSAKELNDLVTRLEAKGFVLPEGLRFDSGRWWYYYNIPCDIHIAAAIIEVAARDWVRAKLALPCGIEYRFGRDGVPCSLVTPDKLHFGDTPLHAIAAAVEASK